MPDYTTIRVRRSTARLIERLSKLIAVRIKGERGIDAQISKDAAIEVAAASYISSDTNTEAGTHAETATD